MTMYILLWPYFRWLHRVKIKGREHIPEGDAVVCANHTAAIDPFYLAYGLGHKKKNRAKIMAKAELMEIPVVSAFIRSLGAYGVNRGKPDLKAIRYSLDALKSGKKLMIFPEGTRSSREESEAKLGAAMLAVRGGAPVLPVYISAGRKRMFSRIDIIFGETMSTGGVKSSTEAYRELADSIMERIWALGPGEGN